MELSAKEKQMLSECETAMRSWKGWAMLFDVMGWVMLSMAIIGQVGLAYFGTPEVPPEPARGSFVVAALGFYFLYSGARERRDRRFAKFVLKLRQESLGNRYMQTLELKG
ncbi:MAG TPA: hypothetical protein VMV72_14875 [Verrucomicrobiae bacterium]|nr:hypothetical protein [Verrucomicrobiae bacterium]